MLATQTTDTGPDTKDVKQWIKEKIAQTLKTLQKRYITTETSVTSEDLEANLLCCALEAIFIHGIKSKFIRSDGGSHGRKGGSRGAVPQPVFWSLLKAVTHRDVIQELERLSFINSDVGRCRAWVRLALNDGLLECYLTSLLREGSNLGSYYQPGALLLDPEDREVLLTLLQGLSSLTFQLSYKSAVLNEWTNTPLVLAGLCRPTPTEEQHRPKRKESWDTISQSSGGSGGSDWAQDALLKEPRKEQTEGSEANTPPTTWNVSLDTSGSSQLSTSLSSDSLLQGHEPKSPEKECLNSDVDGTQGNSSLSGESSSSGQEVIKEDFNDFMRTLDDPSRASAHPVEDVKQPRVNDAPEVCSEETSCVVETTRLKVKTSANETSERERKNKHTDSSCNYSGVTESAGKTSDRQHAQCPPSEPSDLKEIHLTLETSAGPHPVEHIRHSILRRSMSTVSRKTSTDSLYSSCKSTSWISEEDFYKPELTGNSEGHVSAETPQMNGQVKTETESHSVQSPPSVVHRRPNGLHNPFKGLLKLGQLEKRAMGMWWDYYCELTPFEIRLYNDAEERLCHENLSLLRCEDVHLSSGAEGRFRLTFQGKGLYLRAPSKGEAEDWVDRIVEAIAKLRPLVRDEAWEVLSDDREVPSPPSAPSSPEHAVTDPPQLDWTRHTDPETDAIKESVVYQNMDERGWRSLVLSLSLEVLRGYSVQENTKTPVFSHSIGTVRDVVPDVSLGSPAFFKVLTAQETLTLRAESGEESQSWRTLIRGALDLYLETEDDGGFGEDSLAGGGQSGNIHKLVQHRLKGEGVMLAHLSVVPKERGLDAQNYKCAGCAQKIVVSQVRARLCEFSGHHYCDNCHHRDMSIIPSRLVHNWDLTAREVSRRALRLMAEIEYEPLLNIHALNPDLFQHADVMSKVQMLRQQLRFLGDYLLICRSDISKQIQPRLQQRTYLLENSDVYSVLDLQQIADGHYESYLQSLIQFGSKHVHHCDLCTQRGFICQICNTDDIIFPFQFDYTSRCGVCKTVFHSSCKTKCTSCPRCVRIQKYLDRHLED